MKDHISVVLVIVMAIVLMLAGVSCAAGKTEDPSGTSGYLSSDGEASAHTDRRSDQSVEAVSLHGKSFFVLQHEGEGGGLKGGLLSVNGGPNAPQAGAVYTFELEDAVMESDPPQAAVMKAEKKADDAGVILSDLSLAARMLAHLPGVTHLIDVRTPEEYASGHVPGSVNISSSELVSSIEGKIPDKDAVILLYCRSGNRSAKSAAELKNLGYKIVFDLGGINRYSGDIG